MNMRVTCPLLIGPSHPQMRVPYLQRASGAQVKRSGKVFGYAGETVQLPRLPCVPDRLAASALYCQRTNVAINA